MILKNENDIYIFFETIGQLEPRSVLDIGMFLKRIGSVSRKVMNREAPKELQLDGVDAFPEIQFPVWDRIYDHRFDWESFCQGRVSGTYDLSVVLGLEGLRAKADIAHIMEWAAGCAAYVLADRAAEQWIKLPSAWKVMDLQVEEDLYFLLDMGER